MGNKKKHSRKPKQAINKRALRKYLWKYYKKEFVRLGIAYNSKEFKKRYATILFQFQEANKYDRFPTTVRNVKKLYRDSYKSDWGKKGTSKKKLKPIEQNPKPNLEILTNKEFREGIITNYFYIKALSDHFSSLPDYCYIESKTILGRAKYTQCGKDYNYEGSPINDYMTHFNGLAHDEDADSKTEKWHFKIFKFRSDVKDFGKTNENGKAERRQVWILQIESCSDKGTVDAYGFKPSDYVADEYNEKWAKINSEQVELPKQTETKDTTEPTPTQETTKVTADKEIALAKQKSEAELKTKKLESINEDIKRLEIDKNKAIDNLQQMLKDGVITFDQFMQGSRNFNDDYVKQVKILRS